MVWALVVKIVKRISTLNCHLFVVVGSLTSSSLFHLALSRRAAKSGRYPFFCLVELFLHPHSLPLNFTSYLFAHHFQRKALSAQRSMRIIKEGRESSCFCSVPVPMGTNTHTQSDNRSAQRHTQKQLYNFCVRHGNHFIVREENRLEGRESVAPTFFLLSSRRRIDEARSMPCGRAMTWLEMHSGTGWLNSFVFIFKIVLIGIFYLTFHNYFL